VAAVGSAQVRLSDLDDPNGTIQVTAGDAQVEDALNSVELRVVIPVFQAAV
jgi:hypothetical protein